MTMQNTENCSYLSVSIFSAQSRPCWDTSSHRLCSLVNVCWSWAWYLAWVQKPQVLLQEQRTEQWTATHHRQIWWDKSRSRDFRVQKLKGESCGWVIMSCFLPLNPKGAKLIPVEVFLRKPMSSAAADKLIEGLTKARRSRQDAYKALLLVSMAR